MPLVMFFVGLACGITICAAFTIVISNDENLINIFKEESNGKTKGESK